MCLSVWPAESTFQATGRDQMPAPALQPCANVRSRVVNFTIGLALTVAVAACGTSSPKTTSTGGAKTVASAQTVATDPAPAAAPVHRRHASIHAHAGSGTHLTSSRSASSSAGSGSSASAASSTSSGTTTAVRTKPQQTHSAPKRPHTPSDPTSQSTHSAPKSQPARVVVPPCMKRAGLDQIRRLESKKWQAAVVNFSDQKVFVDGPYPSQGAAIAAARSFSPGDVAYQGGYYVARSVKALAGDSSLVAACLQAAAQRSFGF